MLIVFKWLRLSLFFKGPSLAPEEIISSYVVDSELECSTRCVGKSTCTAFNYRKISMEYAANCQISNTTEERDHLEEGEWWFSLLVQLVSTDK